MYRFIIFTLGLKASYQIVQKGTQTFQLELKASCPMEGSRRRRCYQARAWVQWRLPLRAGREERTSDRLFICRMWPIVESSSEQYPMYSISPTIYLTKKPRSGDFHADYIRLWVRSKKRDCAGMTLFTIFRSPKMSVFHSLSCPAVHSNNMQAPVNIRMRLENAHSFSCSSSSSHSPPRVICKRFTPPNS